jgi:hypothetical protein
MFFKSIAVILGIIVFGLLKAVGFALWKTGSFITEKLLEK